MERVVYDHTIVAHVAGDHDNDMSETIGAAYSLRTGATIWCRITKQQGRISGRCSACDYNIMNVIKRDSVCYRLMTDTVLDTLSEDV